MSVLRQLGPQRATRCPSTQVRVGRLVPFQHARRDLRNCAVDQRLTSTAPSAPGLRPVPWTDAPNQIKALATLTQRFSKELASKEVDEATLKWFLRDRYFDPVEAEEKLRKTLQWRQTFKPQATTPAMLAAELASGKAYVHTAPDKYGRPAIVIRTRLHKTGQFPITDSKRLAAHMIDTALAQLPPGGEQIVGIFDLRGFEFATNADFQFAAFMVEAFFEYYPRRVGQVLMVEAPWVFFPAWEVIKPLMRKYAALVSFVSVADVRRDYFTPQSLPDDFK